MMDKLIKPIFGILFIMTFSLNSFGQIRVRVPVPQRQFQRAERINRPNPGKRVELVKEGYISMRLKLTPEESKAFWPLYHRYVQELTAVRILKRINYSSSSTDGAEQVRKDLDYESQILNIKKQYSDEFLRVMPPQKVSELFKSEHEFNDELVKQLNERSIRAGN